MILDLKFDYNASQEFIGSFFQVMVH